MWTAAAAQLCDDNLQEHFKKLLQNSPTRHSTFKTNHVLGKVYDALEEFFDDEENNARASKHCTHRLLYDRLAAYKKAQKLAEDKKKAAAAKKEYKTNVFEMAEDSFGLKPTGYGKDNSSSHLASLSVSQQRSTFGAPSAAVSILAGAERTTHAADAAVADGRAMDAIELLTEANTVSALLCPILVLPYFSFITLCSLFSFRLQLPQRQTHRIESNPTWYALPTFLDYICIDSASHYLLFCPLLLPEYYHIVEC